MSSSDTMNAEVDAVKYITIMFAQIWSYSVIILGTISYSLNIYVFTRPALRSNPCGRYFLASSISGFFITNVSIPLRLLQFIYNIDLFGYSSATCKIFTFIVFWTRTQAYWLMAFASVDRYLCSSRSITMRAWSSPRTALRTIICIIIFTALAYIYVLIQYELKPTARRCPVNQTNPPIFNGIWNMIIFSVGPPIVMLVYGLLTIQHVQSSLRRITPPNNNIQAQLRTSFVPLPQERFQRQKTADRQLTHMMLIQCVYLSLLSCPTSIYWVYSSVKLNVTSDALQSAKDDLFSNVAGYLSTTGICTSFYLFTLSSKLFRRELIYLFKPRH